jgi:hypothetical protein
LSFRTSFRAASSFRQQALKWLAIHGDDFIGRLQMLDLQGMTRYIINN